MIVNTSRFGQVEVEDDRVITFPKGLLGFARFKRYVLIEQGEDSCFWWLQALDIPDLAFVVTDPHLFITDYEVPMKAEQARELGIADPGQAQILVIVNKRGNVLTGNLQGPIVVNAETRMGEQLVLADRRYNTRVPLLELGGAVSAASA